MNLASHIVFIMIKVMNSMWPFDLKIFIKFAKLAISIVLII